MRGWVESWERDYGFIRGDDQLQYFVHASYILGEGYKYLDRFEVVEFDAWRSRNGQLQACYVRPERAKQSFDAAVLERFEAKPNPFTPQDPVVDPMLFAGRAGYVAFGVDEMLNHQNLLVTGERGVGKSSYAIQLVNIASGDNRLLERLDIPNPAVDLCYLIVSTSCHRDDRLGSIVDAVSRDIERETGQTPPGDKQTSVLGASAGPLQLGQSNEHTVTRPDGLASAFVEVLVNAVQCLDSGYNGLCVMLDEVEVLDEGVDIASFFKSVVGALRARGVPHISFVVAGISGRVTDLIQKHGSGGRLFTNVHLDPMTDSEVKDIVLLGLQDTGVSITPEALDRLVFLAGSLPSNIQLLSFYSYQVNTDDRITKDDVNRAADRVVNFPRKQQYREQRKRFLASHPGAARLLNDLAKRRSIAIRPAADALNMAEAKVESWLDALVAEGILLETDGQYVLQDPLFGNFLAQNPDT